MEVRPSRAGLVAAALWPLPPPAKIPGLASIRAFADLKLTRMIFSGASPEHAVEALHDEGTVSAARAGRSIRPQRDLAAERRGDEDRRAALR